MKKKRKNWPSKARRGLADPSLLAQLSRAVGEKRGVDAVRILAHLKPDTFDPSTLELAGRALFMRALQGYTAGAHLNAIIADLSLASRYQPAKPQIWFHLALAYLKAGLYSKGMWSLRKAIELRPADPCFTYHAAWAALAGRSPEAKTWISRLDSRASETQFLKACAELLDGISPDTRDLQHGPGDPKAQEGEFLLLRALAVSLAPDPSAATGCPDLRPGASLLREAAGIEPDNPVVALALGNLELQQGNFDRALESLEAAFRGGLQTVELTQCLARLHLRKGARDLQEGDQQSGHASLARARTLAPELEPWVRKCQSASLAVKSRRLAEKGDLAAAVPLWKEMEKGGVSGLPVLHNLALAYERLGDPEKAASYWQRWIRAYFSRSAAAPEAEFAAEAWRRLGTCLLRAEREHEAVAAFRSLLAEKPEDLEAHESLALLSMGMDEWDGALRHLEYLQQNQKESSTRWTQIGLARLMNDDVEGATQAWNRALEMEPGNEAAQSHLVEALEQRLSAMSPKQYALEGLRLIQEVIQRLPKSFAPHQVLAKYFFTFNDRKRAKAALERALQADPQNAEAWSGALEILLRYGTRADCDRLGRQIMKDFAQVPALQGKAGVLFLRHGREKQAATHFQAAIENSTTALVPLNIARAYVNSGYHAEGEGYARLALERDSNNGAAHALLAMIFFIQGKEKLAREHAGIARSVAQQTGNRELLLILEELEEVSTLERQLSVLFRR